MPLITAYRKRDGAVVEIPDHWLDHPRFGADYAPLTAPSRPAGEKKASASTTPAAGDKKE
jgi:hypothetical protein